MKVLVVILALVALVSADWTVKTHDDLIKARGECVESLKVPADYVEKYKKWDFPDEEKTRCYVKCIFENFGLFEAEKGFNLENLVQQLGQNQNKDEVRPEINKCIEKSSEQKADACTWAYTGLKCFIEKNLSLVQQSVKN